MLDTMKLNSFAAKHADGYVGALYMPGIQLLVVGGKFTSGERMNYLIEQKSYREAYSDLNSASERTSRILISDLGPSGLRFNREKDQPFDIVDVGGKSLSFDGKWGGKDNPSREEYSKTFDTTDEQYSQMLQVLIEALKKSSYAAATPLCEATEGAAFGLPFLSSGHSRPAVVHTRNQATVPHIQATFVEANLDGRLPSGGSQTPVVCQPDRITVRCPRQRSSAAV